MGKTSWQVTIQDLLWFVFSMLLSIVVVENNVLLGLAIAIIAGIVFGLLLVSDSA